VFLLVICDATHALRAPAVSRRAVLLGTAAQLGSLTTRPRAAVANNDDSKLQERLAEARARTYVVDEKMRRAREDARAARSELAAAERAAAQAGERTESEKRRAIADADAAVDAIAAAERAAAAESAAAERAAIARRRAERDLVLDRAEQGTLRSPPVLFRARSNQLVDPADARDCTQLENLLRADEQALYELLPAARQYVRFTELTSERLDKAEVAVLKRMLTDADVSQERITRQLALLRAERGKRGCPDLR